MRKFVLTGGTCTGKTTALQALEKEGFNVIPEAARAIIVSESAKGSKLVPWVDRAGFQREVLRRQLESESKASTDVFLDRGIPDGIAFYRIVGLQPPDELIKASQEARYDKIFLLDLLPVYPSDPIRKEDAETSRKIHEMIREIYQSLGYKVINIPALPVSERIKLIKKNI